MQHKYFPLSVCRTVSSAVSSYYSCKLTFVVIMVIFVYFPAPYIAVVRRVEIGSKFWELELLSITSIIFKLSHFN